MAIEQLLVRLKMDAQQYKSEARQAATATGTISKEAATATTATGKMGASFSNVASVAKIALAGAAGAAVVGFVKDSVRAATDLEESMNAVRVTFGDTADDVLAIGESAADSFGLAQSEFNSFAVRFSNFASTIAAGSGRDVAGIVSELTGRIADFASVMNLDVPEAAEKFQSGLAGQVEPLRAFGIDVSANAVTQKALALGLAETSSELTEQDKVLARYQLIMQQTDKTAGDFKNTQDGLANSTRVLSAQFEDFKARAGQELTPVLAETTTKATLLFDILDSDVDLGWTQRLSAGLQLILGDSADAIQSYIDQKTELNELADAADRAGVSSEDLAEHAGSLEDELAALRGTTGGVSEATEDVAEAFEGTELAAQDAAEAIEAYDAAFRRLTDPVFRAIDDQRRLADALANYEEVAADAEATTGDVEDALFGLLEAQQQANSSAAALPETMGRSEQAFAKLAEQLGLTSEELVIIEERLNSLDGTTARAELEVFFKAGGSQAAIDAVASGTGARRGNVVFRQHGGPLAARQPAIVGERGPELFVPSQSGYVISSADISRLVAGLGGTGGRSVNYNIPIQSSGNQNADAQLVGAVASVLRRMETL